jgi:hypothetical protein
VTAIIINVDFIITRNTKDFMKSIISAVTPEELLLINNNKME